MLLGCGGAEERPGPKVIPLAARPFDPAKDGVQEEIPGPPDIRPVYTEAAAELPRARAVCDALYLAPERTAARCCGRAAAETNAQVLADRCARSLSAAVASGAAQLDETAATGCAEALAELHSQCDWVGLWQPDVPAACEGMVRGALAAGQSCRSSFECAQGLHCDGVGPTDRGTCAAAKPDGAPCAIAVDPLGSLLRVEADEVGHPECAGYCGRHRCRAAVAVGAACTRNEECGAGSHCAGDVCVAGRAGAPGERCADTGCAAGSRCVRGTCVAPKPSGETCADEFECRGGCLREGTGPGTCGPRCGPIVPGAK